MNGSSSNVDTDTVSLSSFLDLLLEYSIVIPIYMLESIVGFFYLKSFHVLDQIVHDVEVWPRKRTIANSIIVFLQHNSR